MASLAGAGAAEAHGKPPPQPGHFRTLKVHGKPSQSWRLARLSPAIGGPGNRIGPCQRQCTANLPVRARADPPAIRLSGPDTMPDGHIPGR